MMDEEEALSLLKERNVHPDHMYMAWPLIAAEVERLRAIEEKYENMRRNLSRMFGEDS